MSSDQASANSPWSTGDLRPLRPVAALGGSSSPQSPVGLGNQVASWSLADLSKLGGTTSILIPWRKDHPGRRLSAVAEIRPGSGRARPAQDAPGPDESVHGSGPQEAGEPRAQVLGGPGPQGPRSSGARSSKAQVLGGPGPAGGKSGPAGRGFPSPTPPPSGPNLPEGGGGRPGGKAPRWRARPVRPGSRGRTTRKGMSGGPNAAERVGPGQLTSERRRLPVGAELPARLPGPPGRAAPEPEVLPAGGAGRPGWRAPQETWRRRRDPLQQDGLGARPLRVPWARGPGAERPGRRARGAPETRPLRGCGRREGRGPVRGAVSRDGGGPGAPGTCQVNPRRFWENGGRLVADLRSVEQSFWHLPERLERPRREVTQGAAGWGLPKAPGSTAEEGLCPERVAPETPRRPWGRAGEPGARGCRGRWTDQNLCAESPPFRDGAGVPPRPWPCFCSFLCVTLSLLEGFICLLLFTSKDFKSDCLEKKI